MVRLRVVGADDRSPAERAEALHRARDSAAARARLDAVLGHLTRAQQRVETLRAEGAEPLEPLDDPSLWAALDEAYLELDRYLAELVHEAAIYPTCSPRCPACCTDAPPVLAVEALRMVRALRELERGDQHLQRAAEQARSFDKLLRERMRVDGDIDTSAPAYRRTQLAWRHLGYPCPVLGEDGSCAAYESRPVACRVHFHVEDAAMCEPSHPQFLAVERPPVWGHPREAEVELALATISRLLELPSVSNLQRGLAQLAQLDQLDQDEH